MRTYIYLETDSPVRGMDTRITVQRIKHNRPHYVGASDFQTASWKGAHGEAVTIIARCDELPFATDLDGRTNTYALRHELGNADKYTDSGQPRNAIRIFGI
jgi:hypothetical protein